MANFTEINAQYVTGAGRSRIPRMPVPNASNPPGLLLIGAPIPIITGTGSGSTCYEVHPEATKIVDGVTLYYAFTSLSGGIPIGPSVTTNINETLTQTVAPSGANITQLNVYIAHGSGTEGVIIIDAFDETKGTFVDDMFVKVAPDATGTITHEANYLGAFIAAATEVVSAYNITSALFDQWLIVPGTGGASDTISGTGLTVGAKSSVVAFAYYKDRPFVAIPHPKAECAQLLATIHQYTADYNNAVAHGLPSAATLYADLVRWNKEYLESGCLYPVVGGRVPEVPKA